MRTAILFLILLLPPLTGCTSIFELQHTGDTIELKYEGHPIECELLAVSDSMMYLIPTSDTWAGFPVVRGMIYAAPPYIFTSGEVQRYANRDWVLPFLIGQVLPVVILSVEAGAYSANDAAFFGYMAIFGIIPAVEYLILIAATDEAPGFERPLTVAELQFYRQYARYPQGLTDEQLGLLLQIRKQSQPLTLPLVSGPVGTRFDAP
jgi:hypothetical protein